MSYDIEYFLQRFSLTLEEEWYGYGQASLRRLALEARTALSELFFRNNASLHATVYAYGNEKDLGQGEPTPLLRVIDALSWMKRQRPKRQAMPSPVNVWLYIIGKRDQWFACTGLPECCSRSDGAHAIVPGMMSLDELWDSHQIRMQKSQRSGWLVFDRFQAKVGTYPNALEAQWAATCLAKEVKP